MLHVVFCQSLPWYIIQQQLPLFCTPSLVIVLQARNQIRNLRLTIVCGWQLLTIQFSFKFVDANWIPLNDCWVYFLAIFLSSDQQYTTQIWGAVWMCLSIQLSTAMREEKKKISSAFMRGHWKQLCSSRWFRELTFCASDLAVLFPVSRARQNRNSLKASSVFPRLANACPFLRWPCKETHPQLQLLSIEYAIKPQSKYKRSFCRRKS